MSKNRQKRAKNMEYTDILIKLITVPPSTNALRNKTGEGGNYNLISDGHAPSLVYINRIMSVCVSVVCLTPLII